MPAVAGGEAAQGAAAIACLSSSESLGAAGGTGVLLEAQAKPSSQAAPAKALAPKGKAKTKPAAEPKTPVRNKPPHAPRGSPDVPGPAALPEKAEVTEVCRNLMSTFDQAEGKGAKAMLDEVEATQKLLDSPEVSQQSKKVRLDEPEKLEPCKHPDEQKPPGCPANPETNPVHWLQLVSRLLQLDVFRPRSTY